MKTTLILIRHGFSEANMQKRFAGQTDYQLTDIGMLQAERCAEALKDRRIDAIYSSDLKRAFSTAEPIARAHSLEINAERGLREIFAGEWESRRFDEIEERYSESYSVWKNDIGRAVCDGGESVEQLYERAVGTLKEIAEENLGKTVCVTTHATPIRALCAASRGLGAKDMKSVPWTVNASISIFEYENGSFSAVHIDKSDHLGDITTKFPPNV